MNIESFLCELYQFRVELRMKLKIFYFCTLALFWTGYVCSKHNDKHEDAKKIRVALYPFFGILHINTTENEPRVVGGRDFDVLKIFMKMYNLSFEVVKPVHKFYGRKFKNGTWNGLMGSVVRNEVDIALPTVILNYERYQDVDFSIPFNFVLLKFVTSKPIREQAWTAIFMPFSFVVWVTLVASLIFYGVISYFVIRKDFTLRRKYIPFSIFDLYWGLFESLINQGCNDAVTKVYTFILKLILVVWWFSTVVLTSSYGGVIMSFMFSPPLSKEPRTFSELADAIDAGKYSCGTLGRSAAILLFQGNKTRVGRTIGSHLERNPSDSFLNVTTSIIRVLKDNYASIMSEKHLHCENERFGRNSLRFSEDSYVTMHKAFALRKNFLFKNKLDKVLRRLFEAGITKKIEDDAFGCSEPEEINEEGYRPLNIEALCSPLMLLMFGYILSTICLISEIIFKKFCNRRKI